MKAGNNVMIDVAAAIICDGRGNFLICRRQGSGSCAGLWEFPGGKREAGESMKECLIRECLEELGVYIELKGLYADLSYLYPDGAIHFNFFKALILSGEVTANVHQEMCWVTPAHLLDFDFCPADKGIIHQLAAER